MTEKRQEGAFSSFELPLYIKQDKSTISKRTSQPLYHGGGELGIKKQIDATSVCGVY